jgi:hypothetical protein
MRRSALQVVPLWRLTSSCHVAHGQLRPLLHVTRRAPAGPPTCRQSRNPHPTRRLARRYDLSLFLRQLTLGPGTPRFDQSRITASVPRDPDHDLETAIREVLIRTLLLSRSLDAPVQREGVVARVYCDKRTP